jgi:hypothetical protein
MRTIALTVTVAIAVSALPACAQVGLSPAEYVARGITF